MAGHAQQGSGIIEGINVTPLVDVTLVLLIIFIVTAKMVVNPAVPLDLPTAAHSEAVQTVFSVAVTPDGALSVDGKACTDDALEAKAREALGREPELRAVLQADGDVSHRRVMAILDRLRAAGVSRVAFGTQPPEPASE
jgi:biopolymer transport protein ExbD